LGCLRIVHHTRSASGETDSESFQLHDIAATQVSAEMGTVGIEHSDASALRSEGDEASPKNILVNGPFRS